MSSTTWCSWLGDSTFASAMAHVVVRRLSEGGLLGPTGSSRHAFGSREFRAWVASRQVGKTLAPAPDLGALLDERGLSGPAREDLQRFEDLLAPRRSSFAVGRCVVDDQGSFAVAVYRTDRPGPKVRVGDTFFSGVQLSGSVGPGVVLVEPHVLRRVCTNGAAVHVPGDRGVYARWSSDDVEGNLEAVVEMGLSGQLVRDLESDLRRATGMPLPRLVDLMASGFLQIDKTLAVSIAEALRTEERTVYGLYNAMTRVARDSSDIRTAIALERSAGRLLVALVRRPDRDPSQLQSLSPV